MKYLKLTLVLSLLVLLNSFNFSLSINIRSYDHQNGQDSHSFTRLVLEGDESFSYQYNPGDTSISIKLAKKATVPKNVEFFTHSQLISHVEHKEEADSSTFQVYLTSRFRVKNNFVLERPYRVVFDLEKSPTPQPNPSPSPTTNSANEPETQDPETTTNHANETQDPGELTAPPPKREAIETICIDPGHGGSDLGAVGPGKTTEKEITLKVSQKLKRLIVSKLGLKVEMTREKDEEVSLNSRVSRANNQEAHIFISIHVNSSFRKSAKGPETYYVSLKATDQEAFQLSQAENEAFQEIEKITEDDKLKMILWNMAQTEYIKESSQLADYIQGELNILMHTRNRGVKQAPFRVLMRAAMPAVLIEIAFISSPAEELLLKDDEFLEKIAMAIFTGLSKYIYYHNSLYQ